VAKWRRPRLAVKGDPEEAATATGAELHIPGNVHNPPAGRGVSVTPPMTAVRPRRQPIAARSASRAASSVLARLANVSLTSGGAASGCA
jgi:hypothetical protein